MHLVERYQVEVPWDRVLQCGRCDGKVKRLLVRGAGEEGVDQTGRKRVPGAHAVGDVSQAAALINASTWIGGALGIAIFSAIATSRTQDLLAAGVSQPEALTEGFQRALLVCAIFVLAAAAIALRATNTRGEPVTAPAGEPVPVPETT
jgi:hypothetical protein